MRARCLRSTAAPVLAVLALLLAACSGSSRSDDEADATTTTAPDAEVEEGAYPVTIEHAYGEVVIESRPQRVVTLGYSDQDFVLAFGQAPVAVTDWYGDKEFAVWEWATDELGDAEPTVLGRGRFTGEANVDAEELRDLAPDLIIGMYLGMEEDLYDDLSLIAPTIAPSGEYPPFGQPWEYSTRTVGAALGQPERAEELIAEVEATLAGAAADHPEFEGQTAAVVEQFEAGQTFVRSESDPRTQIVEALGFALPEHLADLAGTDDGAPVSDEQMDVIDTDLLVWNIGDDPSLRGDIEAKPLYDTLPAVEAGRSVFLDDPVVSGALTWGTVLSIPYAVERLVPLLAAVYEE